MKINNMRLPEDFIFTQYSLSTFGNCPLKFRKRYVENLKWNTIPDLEAKRRLEAGKDFHLIAYRHFLGIETSLDNIDGELGEWVTSLRKYFEINPGCSYLPEYKLRMSSDTIKLEANFDLLLINGDSIEIWDWKTHGLEIRQKRVKPALEESLQTIVYMFVLKEQAHLVLGREIAYVDIAMNYWQPNPPKTTAKIRYSEQLHENFRRILEDKIAEIHQYDYSNFNKSLYKKHCKFCEFNWFCNNERVDFRAVDEDGEEFDSENA